MKVSIALLTYNRRDLFERTLASLQRSRLGNATLTIVDNGSTDGTAERVKQLGGVVNQTGNTGIAYGFRLAVESVWRQKADLIVFSGDDFEYAPDWLERLVAFWEGAGDRVSLCGMYFEYEFAWMPVIDSVEFGGQRALVRPVLPGASWSFRRATWKAIAPLVPRMGHRYDRKVSLTLGKVGLLCELPLARHTGVGRRVPRADLRFKNFPEGPEIDLEKWGL